MWSGVGVSGGWDVLDFRRSFVRQEKNQKTEKRGEEEGFLTFLVQKTGEAVILDEMYQVRERRKVGKGGGNFNSHELHFLGDDRDGDDDGTKVVVMHETHRTASSEEIRELSSSSMNETTSPCKVQWDGFRVLDTLTWETMFEWNSYNHVKLAESTFLDGGIESLCSNPWPWDAMHMNAVDMNPHGDYYLSARHTDTIYKISGRDGRVIWRLNGRDGLWNDFVMEEDFTTGKSLRFSRQHHVRWRGENGTHEFISILDNAKGTDGQLPTGRNSRAIVLALYTGGKNYESGEENSSSSSSSIMTASLISSINHPNGKGSYAPRRGNYQFLGTQQFSSSSSSSSNSWISWSEEALHTEHFPNGSIALQASLHANWLGTYRSYKFPWRGIPKEKPVVHSVGYLGGGGKKKKGRNYHPSHHHHHINNSSYSSSSSSTNTTSTTTTTTTIIHVSQNGATEISLWKLYKTIPSGNFRLFLCERPRQGFETQLAWKGFASYVIVEAVDFEGKVLATSEVVETKKLISKDDGDEDEMGEEGLVMSGEVAEEIWWVQEKEREEREGEEERRKGEEGKSLGKGERNDEGSGWWWWLSGAFSMVSDEAESTSSSSATKQQEQQQLQILAAGKRNCVFAFAGGILVAAMLVCVFGVIRLRRGPQRQVQFYQALGKDEDEDEE